MSFSIAPVTGFPPDTPDEFPGGIQWQLDGTDVGDRTVDTVSFVAGDALGMEIDEDDPKRLIITVPDGGGGGGSTVPNLILSLEGADFGNFGGSDYTNWTVTTVQTSTDAEWSDDDGGIKMLSAGLYRVTMTARITPDAGSWPSDQTGASTATKYGTHSGGTALPLSPLERSLHERSAYAAAGPGAQESLPGFTQWTDEYVVEATEADQYVIPAAYASHYLGDGLDLIYNMSITVTKL